MKAELKQKWIEALRSGDYGQARQELHEGDSRNYCCLGVLARTAGISEEVLDSSANGGFLNGSVGGDHGLGPWKNDGDTEYWPEIQETHTTMQRKLAGLNDSGKSFAEIADWIEQHIPVES